jgi:predicted short-subunit dehydrogenase-like oxidoreductase (DUF2520 family)
MLPGMRGKPRIAIVGPGNLGTALAVALHRAGYEVAAIVAHARGESLLRARRVAKQVRAKVSLGLAGCEADVVWFCVPDSEIGDAARDAAEKTEWNGRTAIHSSGALTSDELTTLRKRGAAVASAHPLMTFVRRSKPTLAGVPFAIEGDALATQVARGIVRHLGGEPFAIRRTDKALYHAWGTFASPLLTALLATTEQVAAGAGVSHKLAAKRMMPILEQTLANYAQLGAPRGFSGPIVRGDAETVRLHLYALRPLPAARAVYVALAKAALEYLPAKNKHSLKRLLDSSRP